jgi:hypothetical protein
VFQYELPEVLCGQDARHHCVNVAHLEPYQVAGASSGPAPRQVMEQADGAGLGYGGSCAGRTLAQEQQVLGALGGVVGTCQSLLPAMSLVRFNCLNIEGCICKNWILFSADLIISFTDLHRYQEG